MVGCTDTYICYPAIVYSRCLDQRLLQWFDTKAEANQLNAKISDRLWSYTYARHITTELYKWMKQSALPEINEKNSSLSNESKEFCKNTQIDSFIKKLKANKAYTLLPTKIIEELATQDLSHIRNRLQEARNKANHIIPMVESSEILVNRWGDYRDWWSTNNENYWLIMPNGKLRHPDNMNKKDKKRYLVWKDEVALYRSKSSNASNHHFSVDKLPIHELTKEQLNTIQDIEDAIEDTWDWRLWFSSWEYSPSIWNGWWLVENLDEVREKDSQEDSKNDEVNAPVNLKSIDVSKFFGWGD